MEAPSQIRAGEVCPCPSAHRRRVQTWRVHISQRGTAEGAKPQGLRCSAVALGLSDRRAASGICVMPKAGPLCSCSLQLQMLWSSEECAQYSFAETSHAYEITMFVREADKRCRYNIVPLAACGVQAGSCTSRVYVVNCTKWYLLKLYDIARVELLLHLLYSCTR